MTRQSQEWNNTLDSMQQSRTQERLESQRIIAAKVCKRTMSIIRTMVVKEEQLANAVNQNRVLGAELESLRSTLATHIGLITVWLLSSYYSYS